MATLVQQRANALAPTVPASARQGQWYQRLLALEALRLVQSLPYVHDPVGEEWLQSAWWTAEHGGDCKDLTVLLSSILGLLGVYAQPDWITQTGQMINHVTGQIWLDGQWVWADGSVRGAMLGESPYEALIRQQATNITPAAQATLGGKSVRTGGGEGRKRAPVARVQLRLHAPFSWHGWDGFWSGWPAWWWSTYYPYLYEPYPTLCYDPLGNGFYACGGIVTAQRAHLPLAA
jgi:hypothetical protein